MARAGRLASASLATAAALLACACATKAPTREDADMDLGEAVTEPLRDLNLQQAEIPAALLATLADPYAVAPSDCALLTAEVTRLDEALGEDLDVAPYGTGEKSFENDASDMIEGAVRDFAAGWIPFRSAVRRLTGAERRRKEVEAAVRAGAVRRAYLKGVGERLDCAPPARPHRATRPAAAAPPG